jgi:hypothetical protein
MAETSGSSIDSDYFVPETKIYVEVEKCLHCPNKHTLLASCFRSFSRFLISSMNGSKALGGSAAFKSISHS